MAWLVLLMFVQFMTSQAGVITASAFAFSSLLPIGADPYSLLSIGTWVSILVVVAIAIHVANKYTVVEGVSTALVFLVTAFAVVMVFLLRGTEFSWSVGDLAEGMRFQIAIGSIGVALSMFGLTGVGAGEITAYTYWCVVHVLVCREGLCRLDGSQRRVEGLAERARGWISVMKLDAWVSWLVYTISTAAFYILGAAVLNKQGIVPQGNEVMTTISSIFSTTLGTWGAVVFLAGAGIALFKTIIANVPSLGRQVGNTLAVFGAFDWNDQRQRNRWMRVIMIVLPIMWGLLGTIVSSPLALVILAGFLNAVFLMGVAVATLCLSHTQTDPQTKGGNPFLVMLVTSALAVFLVGIIGLDNIF
jgi:hypothetical protein